MSGVEQGVFNITDGPLSKIVLSRTLHLTAEKDIDIPQVVKHLAQHNPRGYTFAADVTGTSETRKTLSAQVLNCCCPKRNIDSVQSAGRFQTSQHRSRRGSKKSGRTAAISKRSA